jgi:hypothetical protein
MKEEMKKALDLKNNDYHLNLGFNMEFDRQYPPGSNHKATLD